MGIFYLRIDDSGFYTFDAYDTDVIDLYDRIRCWMDVRFELKYYVDWTCSLYGTEAVWRFKDLDVAIAFKLTWQSNLIYREA